MIPTVFIASQHNGQMLEVTEAAAEVLRRAYDAARRFNPDAKVRVFLRGATVETGFADSAEPGDTQIEHEGMPIFIAPGIEGKLDTSTEHDRLIVV